jgi:hypothetical protein
VRVPPKHNPTPEERDERVKLPLDPETAMEAILATGPHRDEEGGGSTPRRRSLDLFRPHA